MRHGIVVGMVLAAACGDEAGVGGIDDDRTEETEVPESGTDTGTVPEPGCFADYTFDLYDDGELDGSGIDVYDVVRTDKIVYSLHGFYGFLPNSTFYSYDAAWNLVLYEVDAGDDEVIDFSYAYAWDMSGNLIQFEADYDGDGDADDVRMYSWDDAGNISTFEWDQDGDGDVDYGFSYVYDAEGFRLEALEDQDGDGAIDIWFAYAYDAIGRRTSITGDAGNDGTIDLLLTLTYTDPILRIGTSVLESTIDEYPNETEVFEYDAQDRLLFLEEDVGADMVIDFRYSAVYDAVTGMIIEEDEYEPTSDPGVADSIHFEYQYDELFRLIEDFREGVVIDEDGETTITTRETWTFGGTCP